MIKTLLNAAQGQRGTGYIHAPLPPNTSHIDALIGSGSFALPVASSIRNDAVQPKNQSASESCLGQSAAQAYRLSCLAKGISCPDLSALTTYSWGRASIGLQGQDIGMTMAAMLTAVKRFGIATETAWPFSLLNVNRNPSATALHSAYDRRGLRGYYSIAGDDAEGVRRALSKKFAVIGAWPVDAYFAVSSDSALVDAPSGATVGWHSMVIEDYRSDGTFGVLNHYGTSWRGNGRCRFTERYLRMSQTFVVFDVSLVLAGT